VAKGWETARAIQNTYSLQPCCVSLTDCKPHSNSLAGRLSVAGRLQSTCSCTDVLTVLLLLLLLLPVGASQLPMNRSAAVVSFQLPCCEKCQC